MPKGVLDAGLLFFQFGPGLFDLMGERGIMRPVFAGHGIHLNLPNSIKAVHCIVAADT